MQALLHRYETFHRADGKTVKLPMDRGEGQQWNRAPGNLYSTPRKVALDPGQGGAIEIALDKVIPPIPDPPETKYIKHVRIQSERLTKFWGRPMYLGAHVLLPEGFDEHPDARYPLVIDHGHFPYTFDGFREEPPDPNLKPDYSASASTGRATTGRSRSRRTSSSRTGPAPASRGSCSIQIQHANPYYDDSYAVNSENLGPYGDAINEELIPYIEKHVPRPRAGLGAVHVRRIDGRLGGAGRPGALPRLLQRLLRGVPRPDRLPASTPSIDIYKDTNAFFDRGPVAEDPAARPSQLPRPRQHDDRGR